MPETLLRPSLKPRTSTGTALLPLKIIAVKQSDHACEYGSDTVLIRLKSSPDPDEISKDYKLLTLYDAN